MLNIDHKLSHEAAERLVSYLSKTLVLMPVYSSVTAQTQTMLYRLKDSGARVISVHHLADVARARCILATMAFQDLREQPETEWVLWLDADISVPLEELYLLYVDAAALTKYAEERNLKPPAVSARYLNKVTLKVEALHWAPRTNDDAIVASGFMPVTANMGCLLQPVAQLMALCNAVPKVGLYENGEPGYAVCESGGAYRLANDVHRLPTWESEGHAFTRNLWDYGCGGVMLSRAYAHHAQLSVSQPTPDMWPEEPGDTPDAAATRREPSAQDESPSSHVPPQQAGPEPTEAPAT